MAPVWIHVAVGVITNAQSQIFIAKRAAHVHQGGLWEFPGGKVEAQESVQIALARELREELGIIVQSTRPLIQIRHDYGDKAVLLDVHWVDAFSGAPRGAEGQAVRWVAVEDLSQLAFPKANLPIINALQLPTQLAITPPHFTDTAQLHAWLDTRNRGVILRDPALMQIASARDYVAARAALIAQHPNACIMLNTRVEIFLQLREQFPALNVGLHLNRHQLAALVTDPSLRADLFALSVRLGASCHNQEELAQACALKATYVVLSPVNPTSSHPDAVPLGMAKFADLCRQVNVPVYALGGLAPADATAVIAVGGQGVAGISAFLTGAV